MLLTNLQSAQRRRAKPVVLEALGVMAAIAVFATVSTLVTAYFQQIEFTLGSYKFLSGQRRLPPGYPRSNPFIVTNQSGFYFWYIDGQYSRIVCLFRER